MPDTTQLARLMNRNLIYDQPGIQNNADVIEGRRQWATRPEDRRNPETGVPGGVATPPQYSTGKDASYVGQRAGRGLADALGGAPDLVNMALNAGISDAAAIFGNYDPYQFPMASDAIADTATNATGANIIPSSEVSNTADWLGSGAQFGIGMFADPTNFIAPGVSKLNKAAPMMKAAPTTEDLARILAMQGGT